MLPDVIEEKVDKVIDFLENLIEKNNEKRYIKLESKRNAVQNHLAKIPLTEKRYDCGNDNIVDEYIFNTNRLDKTKYKYGEAPMTILSLGKESITLEESVFKCGTDFSQAKIKATVIYADGSFKVSMITPANYEELNNAAPGTYNIEWEDNWGSYTAQIQIN